MAKGKPWSQDELLVAMNLYCKLPFGQFHNRNADIVEVAEALGRSASSVSMKLCNFASLDPYHKDRGVKGLKGASRGDREVWEKFNAHWDEMAAASEERYQQLLEGVEVSHTETNLTDLQNSELLYEEDLIPDNKNTETLSIVKVRQGQRFFRQSVLSSYGSRCCVTGNPVPELLVASHIVPWAKCPEHRLNPRNGLCLASTHDAAFDKGLVTIDEDFRLVVSDYLKGYVPNHTLANDFLAHEGKVINMPEKFHPDQFFLEKHRKEIFVG